MKDLGILQEDDTDLSTLNKKEHYSVTNIGNGCPPSMLLGIDGFDKSSLRLQFLANNQSVEPHCSQKSLLTNIYG